MHMRTLYMYDKVHTDPRLTSWCCGRHLRTWVTRVRSVRGELESSEGSTTTLHGSGLQYGAPSYENIISQPGGSVLADPRANLDAENRMGSDGDGTGATRAGSSTGVMGLRLSCDASTKPGRSDLAGAIRCGVAELTDLSHWFV